MGVVVAATTEGVEVVVAATAARVVGSSVVVVVAATAAGVVGEVAVVGQ